jgi:hypothetical protein
MTLTPTNPADEEPTFLCPYCKTVKPVSKFPKTRYAKRGFYARCNDCFYRRQREYYSKDPTRKLARTNRYKAENPHKFAKYFLEYSRLPETKAKRVARARARYAIGKGIIPKEPCIECGAKTVAFHHTQGYEGENWQIGVFLCRTHHSRMHRLLREAALKAGDSHE